MTFSPRTSHFQQDLLCNRIISRFRRHCSRFLKRIGRRVRRIWEGKKIVKKGNWEGREEEVLWMFFVASFFLRYKKILNELLDRGCSSEWYPFSILWYIRSILLHRAWYKRNDQPSWTSTFTFLLSVTRSSRSFFLLFRLWNSRRYTFLVSNADSNSVSIESPPYCW